MHKILGIISIIIGIWFFFSNKETKKQKKKLVQEVEKILIDSDRDDQRLENYNNRWLIISTRRYLNEGFGFFFIIYWIDLLTRN